MTITTEDLIRARFGSTKGRPRKARKAGTTGKTLEKLVLASQSASVRLVKIPNGTRWIGNGKTIPVKSPVDFAGVAFGRAIFFDAKESSGASFDACETHLQEHQRQMLLTMGEAGAVAGLLILATRTQTLHWLSWSDLRTRKPTYPWAEMVAVGTAKRAIGWQKITLRDTADSIVEAFARTTV